MADTTPPTIFAEVRYRDPHTAMDLLTNAFGFEQRLVVPDEDGTIVHAEFVYGNGLVMLGAEVDESVGLGPTVFGGSCLCVVVDDPDRHHQHAAAYGVDVVMPLRDTNYGARSYAARDHEGNLWVFSNYQPLAGESSSNS
jgi:uncharacterized glyoxalase superfamily protein PhnB